MHPVYHFLVVTMETITILNLLLLAGITLTLLEIDRLYCLRKVLMTKNNVSYISGYPTHFQRS